MHGGWRSISITSSERAIRDLAMAVKLERQHGEALRLIDQAAALDGLDHIFDRLSADFAASDFKDWKTETFAKISDACERNHGKVFRKYIKCLIAHGPDVERYVDKRIAFFVQYVCDEFDGDVARDVAEKYGLLYAGGMLAIRYELAPWEKDELLDAITKCYVAARDLLPDDGVSVRQGVENFKGDASAALQEYPICPKGKRQKIAQNGLTELGNV